MALPPIVTNSPLFKVLDGTSGKSSREQPQPAENAASSPQDKVTLSDDALRKLDELKSADLNAAGARQTAADVRTTLEENPGLTLGSDDGA